MVVGAPRRRRAEWQFMSIKPAGSVGSGSRNKPLAVAIAVAAD